MKQNKVAIFVTAPVTLISLVFAFILSLLGQQWAFWMNVLLGVFGSALLGLITSIINYSIERKSVIDTFFLHYIRALNNFRRFLNNKYAKGSEGIDITIQTILRMDEFDYFPLDDAFRNMSFLINNKKTRNRIFDQLYKPVVDLHRKVTDATQVIENYQVCSMLNDRLKKELIDLLDDCSDVAIASSIPPRKSDNRVHFIQVIEELQKNADVFFNTVVSPSKSKGA